MNRVGSCINFEHFRCVSLRFFCFGGPQLINEDDDIYKEPTKRIVRPPNQLDVSVTHRRRSPTHAKVKRGADH